MKFSVLLPTRNRLEYLRYAVETVLRQDYDDWELIISDNFSEDDIAGYVRSLDDARVKYYRTDSFVPVTDNWNNALDKSSGEYVIMLGDDDGLMQGYFATMNRLIGEFSNPDLIYTSAFLFSYPGVMPGFPDGYLMPVGCAEFLASSTTPHLVSQEQALDLVQKSMKFQMRVDYNMQYSTISRTFIDSLRDKGPFFQSPFPDFYATNVTFLKAKHIIACPLPLVTIGITPKSYGFFHYNNRESEGMEFLKSRCDTKVYHRLRRVLMPGTNINTGWLLAMETVRANYGSEFKLRVDYRRYRLLQIIYVYQGYYLFHELTKDQMQELKRAMSFGEKLAVNHTLLGLFILRLLLPRKRRGMVSDALRKKLTATIGQVPDWNPPITRGRYKTLIDVFDQVNPKVRK